MRQSFPESSLHRRKSIVRQVFSSIVLVFERDTVNNLLIISGHIFLESLFRPGFVKSAFELASEAEKVALKIELFAELARKFLL